MDSLSYIVTSFTSPIVDQKFIALKEEYGNLLDLGALAPNQIITKNHAHITLKSYAYLKDTKQEAALIEALRTLHHKQFLVRAEKIEIFRTTTHGNVLVALVNQTDELTSLHTKILTAFEPFLENEHQFDGKTFTPHLSILYYVPENRLDELVTMARNEILPLEFVLNEFVLLREVKAMKGVRNIIKKYSLKK